MVLTSLKEEQQVQKTSRLGVGQSSKSEDMLIELKRSQGTDSINMVQILRHLWFSFSCVCIIHYKKKLIKHGEIIIAFKF